MDELQVFEKKHQAVVSSRTIAEHFEKRHDHVLRDIDKLIINLLKIGGVKNNFFFETTYQDQKNETRGEVI